MGDAYATQSIPLRELKNTQSGTQELVTVGFGRPVLAPADEAFHRRDKESVVFSRCPKGAALDVDPIEADALSLHKPGSDIDRDRANSLQELYVVDPSVAQFLECLGSAFGTLQFAFQHLDVDHRGRLLKNDFIGTFSTARPPGNNFPRILEIHMQDLFIRLDRNERGALSLNDILDHIDSDDLMLRRMGEFLAAAAKSDQVMELRAGIRGCLERCLKVVGSGTAVNISPEDFVSLFEVLKYPRWHFGDLFHRLDFDGSNDLTCDDFLAAFGKRERFVERSVQPVDYGETQQRTTRTVHIECGALDGARELAKVRKQSAYETCGPANDNRPLRMVESMKMRRCRPKQQRRRTQHHSELLLRTCSHTDAKKDVRHERPDFCGIVREGLDARRQVPSTRNQNHQVFSRSRHPAPVVPGKQPGQLLAEFFVDTSRPLMNMT